MPANVAAGRHRGQARSGSDLAASGRSCPALRRGRTPGKVQAPTPGRTHGRGEVAGRRSGRRAPCETGHRGPGGDDADRPRASRRRVERDLRRLQPQRRSARRGTPRRRLRRVRVAQLEVPPPYGRRGARLRGRPRPLLRDEGGERPRPRRRERAHAAPQEAARAPPAGPARATRARPRASGRHLDHRDGSREPPLLRFGGAPRPRRRARGGDAAGRNAPHPPRRAVVPSLRGLLLEERPGLHLALLDHAETPPTSSTASTRRSSTGPTSSSSRRPSAGGRRAPSTTAWRRG
jgi:hypothetical protein